MNENEKKQILKQIELCRQSAKNNFELNVEAYNEINNTLFYITQILLNTEVDKAWNFLKICYNINIGKRPQEV